MNIGVGRSNSAGMVAIEERTDRTRGKGRSSAGTRGGRGGRAATTAGKRPDRRAQIVTAATTVLGRRGYANTSLKNVASEAGIAPGLLHYYFQSKEDLLLEVVAEIERQMIANWEVDTAGLDDPMAKINAGMSRAVENWTTHPEFFRLLLDTYALALDHPAIGERAREMIERSIALIRGELDSIAGILPVPVVSEEYDFPGALAGALDGIAFLSLVRGKSPEAAFNAFKLYILGLAAVSYLAAGNELPAELAAMIRGASAKA
jgi:AcrR family transcriptional regulator